MIETRKRAILTGLDLLAVFYSSKDYPTTFRRVVVRDEESGTPVLHTNRVPGA